MTETRGLPEREEPSGEADGRSDCQNGKKQVDGDFW
jgi:hypothetical protein